MSVGFLCYVLVFFCFAVLRVLPSFAIIPLGNREIVFITFILFLMPYRCYHSLHLPYGASGWYEVC